MFIPPLWCILIPALQVNGLGWAVYLHANPRPSFSLSKAYAHWAPGARLKYDTLTDRAWSQINFIARPLSGSWAGKLQPVLAISSSRLVVAAGNTLHSFCFGDSPEGKNPPIVAENARILPVRGTKKRDMTAMSFVEDGGLDETLLVGFYNGIVQPVSLNPEIRHESQAAMSSLASSVSNIHAGHVVESLSWASNLLLSLSADGSAALTSWTLNHNPSSSIVRLNKRSWASFLSTKSTPFAALGTSSSTPLTVYSITSDELSATPSAILSESGGLGAFDTINNSAVYGIASAPLSSPWGSSPQIIAAGWYSGEVTVHDLRSSSRTAHNHATDPAPLRPVLTLGDPWSYEPIYSVSCGGGASSHIAAGSARHGVCSLWDVRTPSSGWSVHAPGNDSSPVYSVILESSRLFGATQSRPFVYDFVSPL